MLKPDPREYETRIWYSAEKGDECFVAQVVEWPGIMAHGIRARKPRAKFKSHWKALSN